MCLLQKNTDLKTVIHICIYTFAKISIPLTVTAWLNGRVQAFYPEVQGSNPATVFCFFYPIASLSDFITGKGNKIYTKCWTIFYEKMFCFLSAI